MAWTLLNLVSCGYWWLFLQKGRGMVGWPEFEIDHPLLQFRFRVCGALPVRCFDIWVHLHNTKDVY
jgi:hypothetical protein